MIKHIVLFKSKTNGQALIILLFFMAVALTVTSATVMSLIVNSMTANIYQLGTNSLSLAESGAENALIRLIRDPNYSGENLAVGNDNVNITVTGSSNKIITATSTVENNTRKIEIRAGYNDNILTISSWKEVP